MKQKAATLLILLVITLNGCAVAPIDDEIPLENQATQPDKPHQEAEIDPNASRLWFHARNEQQQRLIESLGDKLKLDENIIIEPVQLVEAGPRHTQLRFFTLQDKDRAKELLKKFKKFFPKLQLLDLSLEYGASIAPKHFELWLAPDLSQINQPQPEKVSPSVKR